MPRKVAIRPAYIQGGGSYRDEATGERYAVRWSENDVLVDVHPHEIGAVWVPKTRIAEGV
jgi:hypothetical protein